MQVSEGKIGRVFVLRLEAGDTIPASIESFAREKGICTAYVSLIGCLEKGKVVSGPVAGSGIPPQVLTVPVEEPHETTAGGLIVPDGQGNPVLHIHGALGRDGKTVTGCLRQGLQVWCYSEAVVIELEGIDALRLPDQSSGFTLMTLNSRTEHESASAVFYPTGER